MTRLVDSAGREAEVAPKIPAALGVLGLATASTGITMAVSDPPAWLDSCAYHLAASGAFFAGVAELSAAVWMLSTGRGAAGMIKKVVVYGAVPFAVAAGLSALASLF